jgi:hypothetical protein
MRKPLHYSSALLVKRAAAQSPILNIPAYSASPEQAPAISDEQIAELLQNIQTYPIEQQKQILDNINKDYDSSQRRGGIFGRIFGDLRNTLGQMGDGAQEALGQASQALWGGSGFDTQDASRDRAQVVLQNAAKNPEMFKRLTERLNKPTTPAPTPAPTTQPAPAPTPAPATVTPQPAPGLAPPASLTPPAPTPPAAVTPVAPPTNNSTATINRVITGGFAPNTGTPQPKPQLVSAPAASPVPTTAPAAPVRKEGLIEGIPASQWIATNKARQQQAAAAYTPNKTTTPPAPTAPTPTALSAPKPSAIAQPTALAPEQQKMLDAYRRSPAGRWQNMSPQHLRAGVASDLYGRI